MNMACAARDAQVQIHLPDNNIKLASCASFYRYLERNHTTPEK